MSWQRLRDLGVQIRPINDPALLPRPSGQPCRFKAGLSSTLDTLGRELEMLKAKHVVLQVDFREGDLRIDGLPRADRRLNSPGIILAFDSRFGPQQYPCNEFSHWEDNLRGIALSLEGLRRVDRYGVSKRGEQYTGWKAIPSRTGSEEYMDLDSARAYIDANYDGDLTKALRATHPDLGGDDPAEFARVRRARELIKAAQ